MLTWQRIFLVIFALIGVFGSFLGYRKSRHGKENIALTPAFFIYGAFVWADIVIFGVFWFIFSTICVLLNDWLLFLLGYSVFWLVRGLGETFFWFNQQFSNIKRHTHEEIFFSKFFGHDEYTVWFVMQILMQCVTVVASLFTIYFTKLWVTSF